MTQYQQQASRTDLCQWLDLPRSVSYYKSRTGLPGAKISQMTMKLDGTWVTNEEVITRIRQLLDTEFNAFGYEYTAHELKKEYIINKKNGAARAGVPADARQWFAAGKSDSIRWQTRVC